MRSPVLQAPLSTVSLQTEVWIGRAMSIFSILFLFLDSIIKLLNLPIAGQVLSRLGWSPGIVRPLGLLIGICTVLYAHPRTALLGAVLITGYLGGAVAIQLRAGSALFSHVFFGIYIGSLVWGGLWLRDSRLRALFPYRRAR